ncbi:MAG: tRNA pseudouridine(55) synthase TruB [Bacilli bacterium]|nr:tRNA pseudouridine(55) synthase TruB [Bacilli bacterium]
MLNGIILLDKEEGLTSRKIDNRLQRLFGTRKVGHLGTLDPFATGLLVIGVNKGTKALTFIGDERKTYIATLVLGKKTNTGDLTGEFVEEREIKDYSDNEIVEAMNSFIGKSQQIPPMTSAIKVNGQALYKSAHKGIEVERKPRDIEVFSINLINHIDNQVVFEVCVSRGTYIRVLGEDIAVKLGTVGYLSTLRRTKVNDIDIKDAKKLDDITESDLKNPCSMIKLPHYQLNDDEYLDATCGRKMKIKSDESNLLLEKDGDAVAVYKKNEYGMYESERGLF